MSVQTSTTVTGLSRFAEGEIEVTVKLESGRYLSAYYVDKKGVKRKCCIYYRDSSTSPWKATTKMKRSLSRSCSKHWTSKFNMLMTSATSTGDISKDLNKVQEEKRAAANQQKQKRIKREEIKRDEKKSMLSLRDEIATLAKNKTITDMPW